MDQPFNQPPEQTSVDQQISDTAEALRPAFKMLAGGKRLKIFEILLNHPEGISVTKIGEALGMEQQAISQNLDGLRRVGLVESIQKGRERIYTVSAKGMRDLVPHLRTMLGEEFINKCVAEVAQHAARDGVSP